VIFQTLPEFINDYESDNDGLPCYWYQGYCPRRGEILRLPRTPFAEAIAQKLMRFLATDERYSREGKMYGILLVETVSGERGVLKAFSGLLQGESLVEGWVPPIPGRDQIALEEAHTLAILEQIKQDLIKSQKCPERQQYKAIYLEFETRLQELALYHRQRRQERHQQRQIAMETLTGEALSIALAQLDEQSRRDKRERRHLKRQRDEMLQPLQAVIQSVDTRLRILQQRRKNLSRQLQAQMHAVYCLTNFAGESLSLQQLIASGSIPTGTGDCCAPKLLHYAATHALKPLAMAEFWWGSVNLDRIPGKFYGACQERCQPLMGFLLSGLSTPETIPISDWSHFSSILFPLVYEDEWIIAVNKPARLLSVPGRYGDRQDSVLSRLRYLLPDGMNLSSIHRLDQETSGILLLARDKQTYRHLSQQFQQRQVEKVYEAILDGIVTQSSGIINLPLWGNPDNRPYQTVDWQQGKPSLTRFQVIAKEDPLTRLEFFPLTGRTHQIRVHASDHQGLGIAILGDRLYGNSSSANRLHLHARELSFQHPQSGKRIRLRVETPF
jgi:tRNA pseudouridine32 synthase/23S rRNA pseudouridine746 synthase